MRELHLAIRCDMSIEFCVHLVQEELLAPQQFVRLISAQIQGQIPLPTLAIRNQLLTIRQAVQVLELQDRVPKRFECLVLELGLLTPAQVDQLLQSQREQRPCLRRMLAELGFLAPGQILALYAQFLKRPGNRQATLPPQPKFARRRIGTMAKVGQ